MNNTWGSALNNNNNNNDLYKQYCKKIKEIHKGDEDD